jgi:hypothetical protein
LFYLEWQKNKKGIFIMNANCNWWQYARWVYLIGRSYKYRYFTEEEQAAMLEFISAIAETRPYIIDRLNLKKGLNGKWELQNGYSVGRAIQLIGRQLKVQILSEDEKTLCDTLFGKTDKRRFQTYNDYVTDAETEEEEKVEGEENTQTTETQNPAESGEKTEE